MGLELKVGQNLGQSTDLIKRRQNTHQHTRVQHLWGLLSAGCCLVTEGPVGSIRDGWRNIACHNKNKRNAKRAYGYSPTCTLHTI